jgi:hypothetical protein
VRVQFVAAAAVAVMASGAAPAQEAPLTPGEVEFRRMPNPDSRFRLFPNQARQQQIEGRATVVCRVQAAGGLEACTTKAESPEGLGFGEATERLATEEIKLGRKARDGSATEGRLFQFSRIWALRERRDTARVQPIDTGNVDADGLRRRWIKLPDAASTASCFRRKAPSVKAVQLRLQCRSALDDRVRDCKVAQDGGAPGPGVEEAGICAVNTARFRVEDATGKPVAGAEIRIPLNFRKP